MPAYRLEELPALPHPLGRHVNHDPASVAFRFTAEAGPVRASASWKRRVPIFDQGQLGSCTGNAAVGWLVTDNAVRRGLTRGTVDGENHGAINEADAVSVYSAATLIDPWDGAYPPDDTGSDGLSVAQVLQQLGFIDRYEHCFSLRDVIGALQTGPVLIGIPWYEQMFRPDPDGFVTPGGQLAGGHEILAVAVDITVGAITFANSWGRGWGDRGYGRWTYATLERLLSEDGDATVPHAIRRR